MASVLGLLGCANQSPDGGYEPANRFRHQTLWPQPPDQPRFEYIGTLRTAADVATENDDSRLERLLAGRETAQDIAIHKPSGIAAREGLVYVAEPAAKAITVFDAARGKLFRFGQREPYALINPAAIALDARKNVYVLDRGAKKIMIYDNLGLFLTAIPIANGFTHPVAVAASPDGETIYVVDRGGLNNTDHKVVALNKQGIERLRIGPRGDAEGRFNIPLAAATDADGSLYVADTGNFRIQKFDSQGRFLFAFGGPGAEMGRFSRPRGIALDNEGNIYVSDGGFGNVQIFNPRGQFLMHIGDLRQAPVPGRFPLIAGIALDETGKLYVNDHYYKKIEVFKRLNDDEGLRRMSAEH